MLEIKAMLEFIYSFTWIKQLYIYIDSLLETSGKLVRGTEMTSHDMVGPPIVRRSGRWKWTCSDRRNLVFPRAHHGEGHPMFTRKGTNIWGSREMLGSKYESTHPSSLFLTSKSHHLLREGQIHSQPIQSAEHLRPSPSCVWPQLHRAERAKKRGSAVQVTALVQVVTAQCYLGSSDSTATWGRCSCAKSRKEYIKTAILHMVLDISSFIFHCTYVYKYYLTNIEPCFRK